ncbi:MAG: transposase [Bryobacteraceae bacterium]
MKPLRGHYSRMRPVYLISFCCYGSVLPGQAGSVDNDSNLYGSKYRPASAAWLRYSLSRMRDQPCLLSERARKRALSSIVEVCSVRNWNLLAAHVRSNHVHAVVEADVAPEKVLLDFKVISSRALNELEGKRTRWARHGSTLYLWTKAEIDRAVRYVVSEQGAPLALYEAPARLPE